MDQQSVDDDAFLTQLESKLRGPFSSLDFARSVSQVAVSSATTSTTRGGDVRNNHHNVSSAQYLRQVARVLQRAEKVTQLRLLIGLLGFESTDDTNEAIRSILKRAQEAPIYEEWVRVVAGIVQHTLFGEDSEQYHGKDGKTKAENDFEADDPLYTGQEVKELLEQTCREIIDRVRKVEHETSTLDDNTEYRLGYSDADPTLAPFHYALLSSDLLDKIIPDASCHHHFGINEGADILLMDSRIEKEKKKEEEEFQLTGIVAASKVTQKAENPETSAVDTITTKKPAISTKERPKSSMFLPNKRPVPSSHTTSGTRPSGRPALMPVHKPVLHKRKAGAAQALLGKNRQARMMTSVNITGSDVSGSSMTVSKAAVRSKMKMIDVKEVQGLEASKKQQEEETGTGSAKLRRKALLLTGRKRSKPSDNPTSPIQPQAEPPSKLARQEATNEVIDNEPTNKIDSVAVASLKKYQAQVGGGVGDTDNAKTTSPPTTIPMQHKLSKQQDWRQMLEEKSNRLTEDDRMRIQQFFLNQFNPTPKQSVYRIKLHEERGKDPETNESFKETYYLELDYSNFTSKQSKKLKRY